MIYLWGMLTWVLSQEPTNEWKFILSCFTASAAGCTLSNVDDKIRKIK